MSVAECRRLGEEISAGRYRILALLVRTPVGDNLLEGVLEEIPGQLTSIPALRDALRAAVRSSVERETEAFACVGGAQAVLQGGVNIHYLVQSVSGEERRDSLLRRQKTGMVDSDVGALERYRSVRSPHLLPVQAMGWDEDHHNLVTVVPRCEGVEPLSSAQAHLTLEEYVEVLLQILDALRELHRAGLIHRDVKEDNILVSRTREGRVNAVLGDPDLVSLEKEAVVLQGTEDYIPPEQLRPRDYRPSQRRIHWWADMYAMGSLLDRLVAEGGEIFAFLQRMLRSEVPSHRLTAGELAEALRERWEIFRSSSGRSEILLLTREDERALMELAAQRPSDAVDRCSTELGRGSPVPVTYAKVIAEALAHQGRSGEAGAWRRSTGLLSLRPQDAEVLLDAILEDEGPHLCHVLRTVREVYQQRWQGGDRDVSDTVRQQCGDDLRWWEGLSDGQPLERLRLATLLRHFARNAFVHYYESDVGPEAVPSADRRGQGRGLTSPRSESWLQDTLVASEALLILEDPQQLPPEVLLLRAVSLLMLHHHLDQGDDSIGDEARGRLLHWCDVEVDRASRLALVRAPREGEVIELYVGELLRQSRVEEATTFLHTLSPSQQTPRLLLLLADRLPDQASELRRRACVRDPRDVAANLSVVREDLLGAAKPDVAQIRIHLERTFASDPGQGGAFLHQHHQALLRPEVLRREDGAEDMLAICRLWEDYDPSLPALDFHLAVARALGRTQEGRAVEAQIRAACPRLDQMPPLTGQPLQSSAPSFVAHNPTTGEITVPVASSIRAGYYPEVPSGQVSVADLRKLRQISQHGDTSAACVRILTEVLEGVGSCSVFPYQEGEGFGPPLAFAGEHRRPSEEELRWIAERREPKYTVQRLAEGGAVTTLLVPVLAARQEASSPRELIAAIYVDRSGEEAFHEGHLVSVDLAAGELSRVHVDRRRAEAEVERARYKYELDAVRETQRSLLPRDLPALPGYRFGALWQPGGKLPGGDGYDWYPLDDHRWVLFLYDVSGHGGKVAPLQTTCRNHFRFLVRAAKERGDLVLGDVARQLNNGLHEEGGDLFVTAILAIVDGQNHTVEIVNAGHPSPLLQRGSEVSECDPGTTGMLPLKLFLSDESSGSHTVELQPGNRLVLFTDGFPEAGAEARHMEGEGETEIYGVERMKKFLMQHTGDPHEVLQQLYGEVCQHSVYGDHTHDDCSGILLERCS